MNSKGTGQDGAGHIARFLKHSTIYAVGNVLNRAGALLLLPLYTNYLTTAEYGALEMFYVVSAVVSGFVSVGIAHATLRFYFDYEREQDRNAVVSSNLIAAFTIACLGATLVGFWREPLAQAVFGSAAHGRGIAIVLVTLVLELSSQVCLAYLRARERSLLFVSVSFAKLVVQCIANAYLVIVLAAGVEGVLLGNLLAVAAGWLFLTGYTTYQCGLRFELRKTLPSLKYSFPFLLSTLTGLVSANVDRVLISTFLSLQILGVYALAAKFATLLEYLVGEPFNRSYGAFRFSIMKDPLAAQIHVRLVRFLFVATLSIGLLIVLVTGDVLRLISNAEFWPATDVLPLLALASLFLIISYPLNTGILYAKRTRYIFYVNLLAAATSAGGNLMLIPWLGIHGAATAQVLVAVVIAVGSDRLSQRFFPVTYEWRPMALALAAAILTYFAAPVDEPTTPVNVALKLLLYGLFLLALILVGAIKRSELLWLRGRLLAPRSA